MRHPGFKADGEAEKKKTARNHLRAVCFYMLGSCSALHCVT